MGLMATGFRAVAGVALVVMGLMAVRVSAQAHHIVGDGNGWGPDLDVSSWLSGRVFSVGDRIWFKYSGTEDSIVELEGFEDFLSCNLTNPIKMYTDPVSHVILDKEGPRYFASRNPERCKNGLKLPVNVRPGLEYDPPFPDDPSEFDPPFSDEPTPHGPYPPFMPTPPHEPPVDDRPPPPPPYEPPVYDRPPPPPPYEPPVHDRPPPPPPYEPPVHDRPPPPPPYEPPVHDRPPPPPPYEPPVHDRPPPPPPYEPPVHDRPPPPPPYEPPVPVRPPPPPPYAPPVPVRPPPPPPYEPPTPSTAARVSAWSLVLAGGMLMWGA